MIEKPMRRKERVMEQERMEALMQRSACVILATVCEDGTPYAVPVSCVYYNKALYFHTAVKVFHIDIERMTGKEKLPYAGEEDH